MRCHNDKSIVRLAVITGESRTVVYLRGCLQSYPETHNQEKGRLDRQRVRGANQNAKAPLQVEHQPTCKATHTGSLPCPGWPTLLLPQPPLPCSSKNIPSCGARTHTSHLNSRSREHSAACSTQADAHKSVIGRSQLESAQRQHQSLHWLQSPSLLGTKGRGRRCWS